MNQLCLQQKKLITYVKMEMGKRVQLWRLVEMEKRHHFWKQWMKYNEGAEYFWSLMKVRSNKTPELPCKQSVLYTGSQEVIDCSMLMLVFTY